MEAETAIRLLDVFKAIKRKQDSTSLEYWICYKEYESMKEELDARRKDMELRRKELGSAFYKRLALDGSLSKMLDSIKKTNELTILEIHKVDETIMSVAEEHNYDIAILELMKAEENLIRVAEELNRENEFRLKKVMEVMEHLVHYIFELQPLKDRHAKIYEKRMEELDREQFMNAVKVKYGSADLEKAVELCSLWEGYLSNPSWQPYKVVMEGQKHKKVLDENDDKLKELKIEFGEEVYEVVTKALNKFNADNPSTRYPLPELWNISKKMRAALKEGVAHLLNDWKIQRGKRL